MTRGIITEGLIDKIIVGLFNAVLKEKRRALARASAADPELKKILLNLANSKKELRDFLEKHQRDPNVNPLLTGLD